MRHPLFGRLAIAGAIIALYPATSSADLTNGFDPFIERPGEMEFSGQMVARPVQVNDMIAQGYSQAEAHQVNDLAGLAVKDNLVEYVQRTDEYIFWVPNGSTENEVAQSLMATGAYEYVEPNWIVYPVGCPNDSRFGNQWQHTNVESCAAWDVYEGTANVTVTVCDTGIRTTHEDLGANRMEAYNAVNRRWENDGGNINDINGHGTNTNGCAAANGNNGRGVSGMGWNLNHRQMRVSNSGSGSAFLSDITHGITTAAQAGDRSINASYSGGNSGSVRSNAASVRALGALAFWSAGNSSQNMTSPNRDNDDVLIIGANTSSDNRASFSNYGEYVDFFAPGNGVHTTSNSSNTSYASVSGTSFSSPISAGAAALMMSSQPGIDADEVEAVMKAECDNIGSMSTFGYGRLNSRNNMEAIGTMRLELSSEPIFRGDDITFFATNGDPNTLTRLAYSLVGTGSTNLGNGIIVDLASANQAGTDRTTNSIGDTFWTLTAPNPGRPRLVWFQVGQSTGLNSNVVATQINP